MSCRVAQPTKTLYMRLKLITTILLCAFALASFGQGSVKGRIKGIAPNKKEQLLAFSNVFWIGTTTGAMSDANGYFSIAHPKGATKLVARTIGFKPDTLTIKPGTAEVEFVLISESIRLGEVVVSGKQRGSTLLALTSLKTEVITASGLCKMACCNLAESFENTASVSVGFSDAVSGARQIRMLGLAGTYTQMLDENRPVMRGIAAPYGLTYTPGQWLESIQVSKGPGTVVNGYESITGQINVEHRKPTAQQPLFVNLFADSDQRTETNITSALQLNERLSTITLVHASTDPMKKDHNKDGFMDMPTAKQVNVANRWLYITPGEMQVRAGVKLLAEERIGGQMANASVTNNFGRGLYRSSINNKQVNAYLKVGMPVSDRHDHAQEAAAEHEHSSECNHVEEATSEHQHGSECNHEAEAATTEHEHGSECNHKEEAAVQNNHKGCSEVEKSIAFVTDYTYHTQDSNFGLKGYNANMHSAFVNLLFQGGFNENNRYTIGTSFRLDKYNELLTDRFLDPAAPATIPGSIIQNAVNLNRQERTAGMFGEYTLSKGEALAFILGARADHNSIYGWMFTPRANVKWDITDKLTFRASGGRGYRSPNPVSDNMGMLATGRQIVIDQNLKMEDAWTYGASVVKYFTLFSDQRASLSLDAFRTEFNNQLIVDQEYSTSMVSIYNLDGRSYTNSLQIDLNVSPVERFSVFLTYRYTDAKVDLKGKGLVEKPMVDKFKALVNVQYATPMNRWTFDFTAQLNGQTRLPNLTGNLLVANEYSEVYPIFFGQITRKFKKVDLYVGCENIGNYRQKNPILAANTPFATSFNSSVVWGPLMGRKAYVGMRFTL